MDCALPFKPQELTQVRGVAGEAMLDTHGINSDTRRPDIKPFRSGCQWTGGHINENVARVWIVSP